MRNIIFEILVPIQINYENNILHEYYDYLIKCMKNSNVFKIKPNNSDFICTNFSDSKDEITSVYYLNRSWKLEENVSIESLFIEDEYYNRIILCIDNIYTLLYNFKCIYDRNIELLKYLYGENENTYTFVYKTINKNDNIFTQKKLESLTDLFVNKIINKNDNIFTQKTLESLPDLCRYISSIHMSIDLIKSKNNNNLHDIFKEYLDKNVPSSNNKTKFYKKYTDSSNTEMFVNEYYKTYDYKIIHIYHIKKLEDCYIDSSFLMENKIYKKLILVVYNEELRNNINIDIHKIFKEKIFFK